jgi:hypothetical protein
MFSCPRCGWQNMIGQRFCASCGETFQYNCPYCNTIVDPVYNICPSCGAALTWGFQQSAEQQPIDQQQPSYPPPPPQQQVYQQQYQQPPQQQYQQPPQQQSQKPDTPEIEALRKKRKKNQLIVICAATGLLICIGVAIYLTITTFHKESPTPAPALPPPASSGNQTSQAPLDRSTCILLVEGQRI